MRFLRSIDRKVATFEVLSHACRYDELGRYMGSQFEDYFKSFIGDLKHVDEFCGRRFYLSLEDISDDLIHDIFVVANVLDDEINKLWDKIIKIML